MIFVEWHYIFQEVASFTETTRTNCCICKRMFFIGNNFKSASKKSSASTVELKTIIKLSYILPVTKMMKTSVNIVAMQFIIVITVSLTDSMAIGDLEPNSGLLLSSLCVQDGHLRKSCLQDVSSLPLQELVAKILDEMRENQQYDILLQELDANNKEGAINSDDIVPDKRDRSRNLSGFYSNW